MSTEDKISNLSGITNVERFFRDNDIESFSEHELRLLCIKLARENGTSHLDAFFKIAYNTLESKKSEKKYWISLSITFAMSLASLIVSIAKN